MTVFQITVMESFDTQINCLFYPCYNYKGPAKNLTSYIQVCIILEKHHWSIQPANVKCLQFSRFCPQGYFKRRWQGLNFLHVKFVVFHRPTVSQRLYQGDLIQKHGGNSVHKIWRNWTEHKPHSHSSNTHIFLTWGCNFLHNLQTVLFEYTHSVI